MNFFLIVSRSTYITIEVTTWHKYFTMNILSHNEGHEWSIVIEQLRHCCGVPLLCHKQRSRLAYAQVDQLYGCIVVGLSFE